MSDMSSCRLRCVRITRAGLYGKPGVKDVSVDPSGGEGSHGGGY
jgi:hypothetical protein